MNFDRNKTPIKAIRYLNGRGKKKPAEYYIEKKWFGEKMKKKGNTEEADIET